MLHQLTGGRVVTAVPVCDQVISQKANQAIFLSLSLRYTSSNSSLLRESSSESLAQAALQLRDRFWYLQSMVHLTLPKTGVSCKKESIFIQRYSIPSVYWRKSLGNLFRLCIYTPR